jgi:hypothetical protein
MKNAFLQKSTLCKRRLFPGGSFVVFSFFSSAGLPQRFYTMVLVFEDPFENSDDFGDGPTVSRRYRKAFNSEYSENEGVVHIFRLNRGTIIMLEGRSHGS